MNVINDTISQLAIEVRTPGFGKIPADAASFAQRKSAAIAHAEGVAELSGHIKSGWVRDAAEFSQGSSPELYYTVTLYYRPEW